MQPTHSERRTRLGDRIVSVSLSLLPRAFRRRFGPEMLSAYQDRRDACLNDASLSRVSRTFLEYRLTVSTALDISRAAAGEHISQRRKTSQGGGRQKQQPARRDPMFSRFSSDTKYALRTLLRRPGFAGVAVFTLALGIGANTAVFTVLNSVILNPLPYDEPDQLVRIYQGWEGNTEIDNYVSGPGFLDYREHLTGLAEVAALYNYREYGATLTEAGNATRVTALPVSSGFFEVYGVRPFIGRTFKLGDEDLTSRTVVVSHRLWTSMWGADPQALGQRIEMDGVSWEIIGIMPARFSAAVGGDVDLWVPHDFRTREYASPITSTVWNNRGNHYLSVIGRLRRGVSLSEAGAELDALSLRLQEEYPRTNSNKLARMVPLYEDVVGNTGTMLYVLMGAAGLVLIIACVNVANLSLARNMARERELAVQSALGSGRLRLITQLLTESLIVALSGGVAGIICAYWGLQTLLAIIPDSVPRAVEIGPDPMVMGFTCIATLLTVVLFGLAPALRFAAPDLGHSLSGWSRSSTSTRSLGRARNLLVTSQVTLAVMLLIGAGLLMRSFARLQQVDLGMAPASVATFEVHLPDARYSDPLERVRFFQALHHRLERAPGVLAVGAASRLPVTGTYNDWGYRFTTADGSEEWTGANFRIIEGGYFDALNVDMLAGRSFQLTDDAESPSVTIINEATAAQSFADRDPIGQTIVVSGAPCRVIGLVRNVAIDHKGSVLPKVYLPHAQYVDRNWNLSHVVATAVDDPGIVDVIRRELAAIDPGLVVHNYRSLSAVTGGAIARERFAVALMGVFATVAVALAAVGIYGVLAYSVNQRTREIGIRMALGADESAVRWAVVRQGTGLTAVGIAVGMLGAVALSRLLESMLFQVGVRDPLTFTTVPTALAIVALVAGYLPARRATRIDPVQTIRQE